MLPGDTRVKPEILFRDSVRDSCLRGVHAEIRRGRGLICLLAFGWGGRGLARSAGVIEMVIPWGDSAMEAVRSMGFVVDR